MKITFLHQKRYEEICSIDYLEYSTAARLDGGSHHFHTAVRGEFFSPGKRKNRPHLAYSSLQMSVLDCSCLCRWHNIIRRVWVTSTTRFLNCSIILFFSYGAVNNASEAEKIWSFSRNLDPDLITRIGSKLGKYYSIVAKLYGRFGHSLKTQLPHIYERHIRHQDNRGNQPRTSKYIPDITVRSSRASRSSR
jgi:hypothetical protein